MSDIKKKPFLQVHLVDYCNLNCKGCAHFSPVAAQRIVSLNELESAYKLLMPYMDEWFCRLELMGGEPLLHDQIDEIILMTRKYYPDLEVRLVTNGLKLLNMKQSFYDICAANDIIICVSIYPIGLDYERIERRLAEYSIRCKFYGEYDNTKYFLSYKLNPRGDYNPSESFINCKYSGHCVQVSGNKLYPCFVSAYAHYLNDYFGLDFELKDGDYLILDEDLNKSDLDRLIYHPVPFCRYCNMKNQISFEWEISQKSISEWITV